MNRSVLVSGALLCVVAGLLALATASAVSRRESATAIPVDVHVPRVAEEPPPSPGWMTEYELTERSGRRFQSTELQGTVHVVNFFFASCPTTCRLQCRRVQELVSQFGDSGVRFLSITCDPQNDTPAALQKYAEQFNADAEQWLFLTSTDLIYLRRVAAEVYTLSVGERTHSEHLAVVDRWGTIRGRFHWNEPDEMEQMRTLLPQLLSEVAPPDEGLSPADGG